MIVTTIASVVSSVAWLFLPPNVRPDPTWFYWGVGIATVAFVAGSPGHRSSCRRRVWLAIPAHALIAFALYWGRPDGIGPMLAGAGVMLQIVLPDRSWLNRVGRGIATAGAVLALQLVGQYLYFVEFGPRGQNADLFAPIVVTVLRFIGANAGMSGDIVRLVSYDGIMDLVPNWVNLGLHPFTQMLLAVLMLVVMRRLKLRSVLYASGAIFVFAIARFCFLLVFNPTEHNFDMFFDPWDVGVSLLFVIPMLRLGLKPTDDDVATTPTTADAGMPFGRREAIRVGVGTLVVVLAWTIAYGYYDSGSMKQGRMMIDEYHSGWERSDNPMDTVWYGQESTYNFYSAAEWYGYHYDMVRGYEEFTPEYLDQFDIIVLKTPTELYSDEEIEALLDWVDDGGGLILIGDHTNVFGTSTVLNQIGDRVGIRFVADIMYDLETGDLNLYDPPPIMPHPVTVHMRRFLWGGPCTLDCDWSARGAMITHRSKTLPADYSGRNFFPERIQQHDYRYGVFHNVASITFGKGRVIAFTDSTLISNFFAFIPGKPELWIGMADWINRMNRFNGWRWILALLAAAGLIYTGLQVRRTRMVGLTVAAAVGVWAFVGTAALVHALNVYHYPLPEPIRPFTQLNLESEHSRFFVPELRLANNQDKDWHTFFVWTQRVEVVPRLWPTLEDAADGGDNLVIIEPAAPFTDEECERIESWVNDGGCLLVLDDEKNTSRVSDTLLARFGITIDYEKLARASTLTRRARESGLHDVIWNGGAAIAGVKPVFTAESAGQGGEDVVVWGQKDVGKGRVIVFSNSKIFERRIMGYTSMIPNVTQNAVSQFTYKLMDMLNRPERTAMRDSAQEEKAQENDGI